MEFRVGYVYKVGDTYYKVKEIEKLRYRFDNDDTAFTASTTAAYNVTRLQPPDDRLFWIESVGINGLVDIQLQFPRGNPRNTAQGIAQYISYHEAQYLNGYPMQFIIRPAFYPTINVRNQETSNIKADIWFWGLQLIFGLPISRAEAEKGNITEITDYATR